ncbi:hypothetical protein diail_281 [Diaporthe ilicicola]|nr:hypothetical protein diail_281 [Diaporthe ilicicola]
MAASSSDPDANPHALPGGLSPDSIDVPSELYTILARLRYNDKNGAATNGDSDPSKPGANTPAAGLPGSTPSGGANNAASDPNNKLLSTKDLAAATDPLKHKIQRARAAVHTLPDIGRTIAEQEVEIKEWQDKIESQRKVLQQLKEFGIQFSHGSTDVDMGGTGAVNSGEGGVSTGTLRGDHGQISSPVTPTRKDGRVNTGVQGDVTGDATGVGSRIIPPDVPLQPDATGSATQAEDLHEAGAEIHHDAPMPSELPVSSVQAEDIREAQAVEGVDFIQHGDTRPLEAENVPGVVLKIVTTGSADVMAEEAVSSALVDAAQSEDNGTNSYVASDAVNQRHPKQLFEHEQQLHEPHDEHHGATTGLSVPTSMDTKPEEVGPAALQAMDEDVSTGPQTPPRPQSPTQSFTTPGVEPSIPKGKQVAQAPAASKLEAANGWVKIPIPPDYHKVKTLLWFMNSTTPKEQPRRNPKKPPKRTPKKATASGTSATPTKTPRKIKLNFNRKAKNEADDEAAPVGETDADAGEDEEVMLL